MKFLKTLVDAFETQQYFDICEAFLASVFRSGKDVCSIDYLVYARLLSG